MSFELTSGAFAEGDDIPQQHTCDGEDLSPPLMWGDPPAGTVSLALIRSVTVNMSDPPKSFTSISSRWMP